jgi:hypothetical protein
MGELFLPNPDYDNQNQCYDDNEKKFLKTAELNTESNGRESSMLEEDEIAQMKQDYVMEHDEP